MKKAGFSFQPACHLGLRPNRLLKKIEKDK
jgi:hypothetical protein